MKTKQIEELYDFSPIRNATCHYFDYAATTFMPSCAMDRWREVNETCGVFIGRGKGILSSKAEEILSSAEEEFYSFFDISFKYQFLYFKNVTEAINILSLGMEHLLNPLDMILLGPFEHHSNYLPWKRLAAKTGAILVEFPLNENNEVDYSFIERYKQQIKVVAVSSITNAFGYIVDVDIISKFILNGTILLVDDSQLCGHGNISTNDKISVHFLSSHKMYGPKNIAIAAIDTSLIDRIEPVLLGGGMVESVGHVDHWLSGRKKFFAGTMDLAAISAWAKACSFLREISFPVIQKHEEECSNYIKSFLYNCGYDVISQNNNATSIISFSFFRMHPHDLSEILARKSIIIRSGHLCAQNALNKIGLVAINRISLGIGVSQCSLEYLRSQMEELASGKYIFR